MKLEGLTAHSGPRGVGLYTHYQGLAHGVKLLRPIKAGQVVTWADVEIDPSRPAVLARREMEARFAVS